MAPEDIIGIHERIDTQGNVVVPARKDEVRRAVQQLLGRDEIEAVAVSLMNSWANPEHEELVLQQLEEAAVAGREVYFCAGHDLSQVAGEYARTNTAVLNAFVGPVVSGYLSGLTAKLHGAGFRGRFLVMQGNGGAAGPEEAPPIANLQSGPAGGMLAARRLSETLGHSRVITADMGGTSFDVGLLHEGEWSYAEEPIFERFRIVQPMIDVKSIGAGGGTIATVQADTRRLIVGPQSAGAYPGPACYGRGGTEATVTDADVVLGFIDPTYFLGGTSHLSREKAVDALTANVADPLETNVVTAAGSIFEIVNNKMADLIRNEIVRAGGLPEEHVLYAFGGAGPLHGPFCADALGIGTVVVPGTSATFSAMGAGAADTVQSHLSTVDLAIPDELPAINAVIASAVARLRDRLRASEGEDVESSIEFRIFGSLRYRRQTSDVEIQFEQGDLTGEAAAKLTNTFEQMYEQRFGPGAVYQGAGIELSRLRVDAIRPLGYPDRRLEPEAGADASAAKKGRREIHLPRRDAVAADVYEWSRLQNGNEVAGPALIESDLTTIAVPEGWTASMDGFRNLLMVSA